MRLSIIPNWRNQNLECYFCKETKSVKYKTVVFKGNEEKEVCICNKCAIFVAQANDELNSR